MVLELLIIGLLTAICIQDFRYRAVSWFLFPALFLCLAIEGLWGPDKYNWIHTVWQNTGLLLIMGLMVWTYFSLRLGRAAKLVDRQIGLGDILFFICAALAFSMFNLILFITTGLLLTLIIWFFILQYDAHARKEIPLAGALSAIWALAASTNMLFPFYNPLDNSWFINQLMPKP